jgi:hypothetical protein
MLEDGRSEQRVSTLDGLDHVLGGLYWGDNVVWQLESVAVEPFYNAIARRSEDFETRTFIFTRGHETERWDGRRERRGRTRRERFGRSVCDRARERAIELRSF